MTEHGRETSWAEILRDELAGFAILVFAVSAFCLGLVHEIKKYARTQPVVTSVETNQLAGAPGSIQRPDGQYVR